jgi:signal transduction histidine kinase
VKKKSLHQPIFSQGSDQDLTLDSTLKELPLCSFTVENSCLVAEIADILQKYPLLPGMILVEDDKFVGMLSRKRFLEYLLLPQGYEIFWHQSIITLYSYARTDFLILRDRTPILTATPQTLRRSNTLRNEPIIIVNNGKNYQLLDIENLHLAYWQIRGIETQVRYERTQTQTIQTEKMASLGRLVDGVAHEILDPVGFIWGNLTHVTNYSQNLLDLIAMYQDYFKDLPPEIRNFQENIELDYLQGDLPRAIASIRTGSERLKKLASSLQNFCYIDEVYPRPADLHSLFDGILLLLKSKISSEIQVIKDYGNLPPVPCFVGQLNQVFINLLSHSIDSLLNYAVSQKISQDFSDLDFDAPKPTITIKTKVINKKSPQTEPVKKRYVSIIISDNSHGMTEETKQQIIASFSTAKRAVKETSITLSYHIITAKHSGEFHLRSLPDQGTEFEILLPLL